MVYVWGDNEAGVFLGNPHAKAQLLPAPVEALGGVRVGSIAAAGNCSYVVADTSEVWAWGMCHNYGTPLGDGEQGHRPVPKLVESLRGVKADAVAGGKTHTLALADDGSVYAWGNKEAAECGALGLGPSVCDAELPVPTPQRIPTLRVACGL
jgi:alpha-tubulin suppressor-like RCC1 family protein